MSGIKSWQPQLISSIQVNMNPEQVHQNQSSSGSGHFEQDSEIQRSAMPPSQLFADPDPPMQRQEPTGPQENLPAEDGGDGGGWLETINELWEKIQAMFGGGGGADAGEKEGKPDKKQQEGGESATGNAQETAVPATDPPNKFVKVNDRSNNQISDAVVTELNAAVDEVKTLTGADIGTGFGDTTRNLGQGTKKVGADNFSWHKSGRAVDFDQGLKWVIAKDPSGNDMYFRLYLQANDAGAASEYAKTFTAEEKKNLHYNAMGNNVTKKPVVDVTAILEKNGFSRIPAHTGWETSYNKREWWHYVKDDGLSWYQAIRQIYTDDQIVTARKKLVVDRHNSGGRLAREGFPATTLKAIWDDSAVTKGKLSLFFSVGSHRNCANLPEDVATVKAALIGIGIADGEIATMISAYQASKGNKSPDGYITVGGSTHKSIGGEMK